MKKEDTRVQYTRHRLRSAILELLREKSIDKITIKEICETAGLNRGTFYLHYDCPAALLSDIEDQFLEENTRLFHSFWNSGREQSIMAALFVSIKKNSDVFCILMGPHGDPNFATEVFGSMRELVLDQWQLEFPQYHREDLDFIFDFVLYGSSRLIVNWLQDSRGISASQFARRMERLGHHALMTISDF